MTGHTHFREERGMRAEDAVHDDNQEPPAVVRPHPQHASTDDSHQ
jgi:hypothetical protein